MTAPNPVASFPVPDLAEQFRMGPLLEESSFDFWWNRQLPDGTYSIADEPIGWEGLDYVLPLDEVGGRDGAFVGPQSIRPRVLEINAMLVAPSGQDLRQHIASIRRILGPHGSIGARQPIIWEQYDWATGVRMGLITRPEGKLVPRVVGGYSPGGNAVQFKFQLVAANPPWKLQTGAVESNQVGLKNPALVQGRTYPKTFNYTYGTATTIGGEMVVVNNGNLPASTIYYITGRADFPIITNVTTGQEWQVNYDIPTGVTVKVDQRSGTVTPAQVRLVGRPFELAPGPNTIQWRTASGNYYPEALLRMEWRSTSS